MRTFITIILICMVSTQLIQAQSNIELKHFNHSKGDALSRYDAVSYFTTSKAVKGSTKLSYQHEGLTYYFASKEHLSLFQNNPKAYLPQYGGWCAYAMGENNEKVPVDPSTFKIINGKLYLFYNAYFNNTLLKWNKDEPRLLKLAEKNWYNIIK